MKIRAVKCSMIPWFVRHSSILSLVTIHSPTPHLLQGGGIGRSQVRGRLERRHWGGDHLGSKRNEDFESTLASTLSSALVNAHESKRNWLQENVKSVRSRCIYIFFLSNRYLPFKHTLFLFYHWLSLQNRILRAAVGKPRACMRMLIV